MAKFKVGDKVKVKGAGVETIKAVYPKGKGSGLDPTQVDMSVDWYETDGSGMIADEDIVGIANSRVCNSTNPVVANAMRARNYSVGFEGEPEYKYYKNILALREKAVSEVRKLEAVASRTATACKKFFDEWKAQKGNLTQEMNRTTELNADTLIVYPVEQSINLLKSSTK